MDKKIVSFYLDHDVVKELHKHHINVSALIEEQLKQYLLHLELVECAGN